MTYPKEGCQCAEIVESENTFDEIMGVKSKEIEEDFQTSITKESQALSGHVSAIDAAKTKITS